MHGQTRVAVHLSRSRGFGRCGLHPRYGILGMQPIRGDLRCRSVRACSPCSTASRAYGYQLRQEFEHRTGGTWPLNVGQVYSDARPAGARRARRAGRQRPTTATDPQVFYAITDAGPRGGARLVREPGRARCPGPRRAGHQAGPRRHRPRRRRPRRAAAAANRDHPRAAAATRGSRPTPTHEGDQPEDLAWSLVLESLIFAAEAEVRWLDHCEARLARPRALAQVPLAP